MKTLEILEIFEVDYISTYLNETWMSSLIKAVMNNNTLVVEMVPNGFDFLLGVL